MSSKPFYITTPIYYVNDIPHIGHAYTTTACDAMSRYKRMNGFDVFFLTGTDEHGLKIQTSAEKQGITPQQLVDKIHVNFKELWKVLNISNNDFIRTTEERHIRVVQAIFKKLIDQGDVYKGTYEGWYCVPCETYVPESSMGANNTCPDCGRPLTKMSEESYFFKASKYVPQLIEYYEKHLNGVMPRIRYNEIMSFLKSGVRDQSVSRTSLKWGIPVPGDENHVIYVWFDALINYATAAGYLDNPEMFKKYWPAVHHVVGKDIIRFHCVIWPLMLLALGVELPVSIIAHGWWTVDGAKMSKSKGNVVDPFKMAKDYGPDPFRYFLLREVPFGNDGDFSETALVGRINSDLANDLGNLLNRTLQMITSYRQGVVPGLPWVKDAKIEAPEAAKFETMLQSYNFEILARGTLTKIDDAMEHFAFDDALKDIWAFIGRANKFIDETEPWKLAKAAKNAEENPDAAMTLDCVLLILYDSLRLAAMLVAPYMPQKMQEMWEQLGCEGKVLEQHYSDFRWGDGAGTQVKKGEVLFPRIDVKAWQAAKDAEAKQKLSEVKPVEHEAEITIDNFKAVEMRVAQIVKVEEIPKSRKLYKLEVNLGYETRTVCSGIKAFFTPEELEGKRVILVTNLAPAKLCGVQSNGMILAASVKDENGTSEKLTLVVPESDIPLGSRVS